MSSSKTKVVNRILAMALALILFVGIVPLPQIANAIGETNAETTVPETDTTVPETDTTVPETDTTVPETDTTVPETETTEPETQPTNKYKVSVHVKGGEARVELGRYYEIIGTDRDMKEVSSREYDKDTKRVRARISVDDAKYSVKSFKINGAEKKFVNGNNYDWEVLNENKNIEIVLGAKIKISAVENIADGGIVSFNGAEKQEESVISGTSVNIDVKANDGYQISAVTIDGVNQTLTDNKNFKIKHTVNKDTVIKVDYIRIYTVTVKIEGNGNVTINDKNANNGEIIALKSGNSILLKAKADVNYRILSVSGLDEDFNDNNRNLYADGKEYSATILGNKDRTVTVTFALKVYKVTANKPEGAEVTVKNSVVNHGGYTTVTVKLADGYEIVDAKYVGGASLGEPKTINDSTYEYTINNINKDTEIEVIIKKTPVLSFEQGVSITYTQPVIFADNDNSVFVYPNNTSFTIKPKGYKWIKINDEKEKDSITFYDTLTIKRVKGRNPWSSGVKLPLPNGKPYNIVIDKTKPGATITPKDSSLFNGTFSFSVNAFDSNVNNINNSYSGIQKISFKAVDSNGKVITYTRKEPDAQGLLVDKTYNNEGVIFDAGTKRLQTAKADGTINLNSGYTGLVNVIVTVTDKAHNVYEKTVSYYVDGRQPKIAVDLLNGEGTDTDAASKGFYNMPRSVQVKFTNTELSFDPVKAKDTIVVKKIVDGKSIDVDVDTLDFKWSNKCNDNINRTSLEEKTYTAEFDLLESGKYTIEVNRYTNEAGNQSNDAVFANENDRKFEIDLIKPVVDVDASPEYTWQDILEKLTFGLFKNSDVIISAQASDNESGVKEVAYYKTTNVNELTEEQLETIYAPNLDTDPSNDKFTTQEVTIKPDEKVFVYVRVTDYANNVIYKRSDGVIVEDNAGNIEITPVAQPKAGKIYNGDAKFDIVVKDNADANQNAIISSGLKEVKYKIECGKTVEEKVIFSKDKKEDITEEFTAQITVNSKKFDTNNIKLTVTATDSAGNVFDKVIDGIAINTKAPTVSVKFDEEPKGADEHIGDKLEESYYPETRTATIVITDRDYTFDSQNALDSIHITKATDSQDKSLICENTDAAHVHSVAENVVCLKDMIVKGTATELKDAWTNEGDKHTLKVVFSKDANYEWNIDYTNDAELSAPKQEFKFTVDHNNPVGTLKLEDKEPWKELQEILTFGLYQAEKTLKIVGTGDETSPYKIDAYISTGEEAENPLNLDQLDTKYEDKKGGFKSYNEGDEIKYYNEKENTPYVVYLRVTDYSGRYTYIGSNGIIIDNTASTIKFTPELSPERNMHIKPNDDVKKYDTYGIYNIEDLAKSDSLDVDVSIDDKYPSSGIKSVKIYTVVDGKEHVYVDETKNLEKLTYQELEKASSFKKTICLNKNEYDSCNTVLYVDTVDGAGNTANNKIYIDIDNTAPEINVDLKGENPNGNKAIKGYYHTAKATFIINERAAHFNDETGKPDVKINIVGTDANGNTVKYVKKNDRGNIIEEKDLNTYYNVDNLDWKQDPSNPDRFTATIDFTIDAKYDITFNYTDRADNNAAKEWVVPTFTIDKVDPTGTVTATTKVTDDKGKETDLVEKWDKLYGEGDRADAEGFTKEFTYGFWTQKPIDITGTAADTTSEIQSIDYYKQSSTIGTDNTKAISIDKLENVNWQKFDLQKGINIDVNQQFAIYLRIIDNAGNTEYISTNGLIVDDKRPNNERIKPDVTITRPDGTVDKNYVYNGPIDLKVSVEDPLVGGTYSGLNSVKYRVYTFDAGKNVETQNETIYQYTGSTHHQSELKKSVELPVVIKTEDNGKVINNSNNICIEVTATDNAGNVTIYKDSFHIDITKPTIDVEYNNNKADSGKYFKENRTAKITVTERNFNPAEFIMDIKNTDGFVPTLSDWSKTEGTGNLDNTKWTAYVTYSRDGDYDFAASCTDIARNKDEGVKFEEKTVAPEHFTVDKTMPTVSVSYDNNSALNKNYYAAERTATVTIKEHNIDPNGVDKDRVKVALTASDNGKPSALPRVSSWKRVGDSHVATIRYAADSLYSFDIDIKDKAGNDSKDFEKQEFYVDKTAPELEITGVKDNSANKDKVVPIVTYSDTNFDVNNVQITLSGANRKGVKPVGRYNNTANGSTFVFADFQKKKEVDDIYTLNAKLTDKAGNSTSKQISFSVNRFGSFYKVSENTEKLNGNYSKKPTDIEITEINANKLSDISITLFKNNQTIKLVEGTDYSINVTGGNGRWYTYKYTIFAKNFKDDGVYRIVVHSKDAAGNISENTLDTKNKAVEFGIDKTKPTIVVTNLEDGKTYPVENLQVKFSVKDNLLLNTVTVYLDDYDKPVTQWNKDEVENQTKENNGEFAFMVPGDSKGAHRVKIVTVDAAGNKQIEEIEDFFVTTDIFVRFFNNKPLFYGSIIGLLLVIALVIFIVVYKKKKNELN